MKLLKYGLKDGELKYIDDVPNGLKCDCVCPNCSVKLVAHKGQKNVHHFKHYSLADCTYGQETALHMMAKSIIKNNRIVFVPNPPSSCYDDAIVGKCYRFQNAYVEKQLSKEVRSDVLLEGGNHQLNVEIKVTHKVDDKKLIDLFNLNISTIEIDLSGMIDVFDEKKVEDAIYNGKNTKLIYSNKKKGIYAKLILGDWKKIYQSGTRPYVKDCPFSHKKASLMHSFWRYELSGPNECHSCWGYDEWERYTKKYLCIGFFGKLDFSKIEKILNVTKENGVIKYAELLVDGEVKRFGKP